MGDSIAKPPKPYREFPMYAHASKRWAAKIGGVTRYFGHWRDWEAALERYQYEVHFYKVGRTPPPRDVKALTVGDMVNKYLEHAENRVHSSELAPRTWLDSKRAGVLLVSSLGRHTTVESLTPNDFARLRSELAKRVALSTVLITIQRCRVFFAWALKNNHIRAKANFGSGFDKPTAMSLEREKQERPVRFYSIEDLTTLYKAATPQMRCLMLLGLNGGFGNKDIGTMEAKHIQDGWIRFTRSKNQVDRECPLWVETIQAIEGTRQSGSGKLVFLSPTGESWHKGESNSHLIVAFKQLNEECGVYKHGRGFYALRHNFRTIANGLNDERGTARIFGHQKKSMADAYIHGCFDPERLKTIVEHVRKWCLPMLKAVAE